MGRYTTDIQSPVAAEQAVMDVEKYLTSEGFKQVQHKGEPVWKKGLGLMLGPQFVKLAPSGNQVHLEAWIKFALLPGVYLGEMGITGAFGMIPKKKLKKRVEAIEGLITGEKTG
jgi:hypothetical protein